MNTIQNLEPANQTKFLKDLLYGFGSVGALAFGIFLFYWAGQPDFPLRDHNLQHPSTQKTEVFDEFETYGDPAPSKSYYLKTVTPASQPESIHSEEHQN